MRFEKCCEILFSSVSLQMENYNFISDLEEKEKLNFSGKYHEDDNVYRIYLINFKIKKELIIL